MAYDPNTTTTAQYSGPLVIENPLHAVGVTGHYFATQRYFVQSESYVPAVLNSTRVIYAGTGSEATLYCVGDTKPNMDEAGTVSYERMWCNVPATWNDYTTFAATFPGYSYAATEPARSPFTREVAAEVENAYYRIGTDGDADYASPDLIPVENATTFSYSHDDTARDASDMYLRVTTTPTSTAWTALVAAEEFTYVVQASTLERYAGNIWLRKTIRVRPL